MREFLSRDTILWAVAAVAVGLNAAVGSYNVRRMVRSEGVLQEARVVQAELAALMSDMKDAETGHRGYVVTGRAEYLEPFRKADESVWPRVDRLRDLLREYPAQQDRLADADRLIRAKFAEMRRVLDVRDADGRDAAAAVMSEGVGRRLMEQVRARVAEMEEAEEQLLAVRAAAAQKQYEAAEYINLIGAAIAIAVLTVAALMVRVELRRRVRANAALAAAKAQTEAALAGLDAFLRHAPYGIAFFDPHLRFLRVNETFAAANRKPVADHVGRPLREVLPDFPADLEADYQSVLATGRPLVNRVSFAAGSVWEVNIFPVPVGAGPPGLGVIGVDVTERYAAEARVRESEGRFRTLAEAMPQIVWTARPDGYRDYFNARWYEFTGQTPDRSIGWGWDAAPHPDDRDRLVGSWRAAVAAGTPYQAEYRLRRHDGAFRWILVRATPVRTDAGEVVRWLGTCTDIDDQRRAVDELRDSRRFVESVLHSLPSHLAVVDADGAILAVNASWVRFGEENGVPPGYAWVGRNYFDACRPAGAEAVRGIRAVAAGDLPSFEMEYPCHGRGAERFFLLRVDRFRGDGPVRLVLTHENVTARVLAERSIREAASQLSQLTEGLPLMVWACRADGPCEYLSRQWVDYTGLPLADQLGYGWLAQLHPDDRDPTARAWARAVQESGAYDVEFRIRRHDGEYRWFAVRGIPLRDSAGRVGRWYGACTDIDDRKRQADVLERLVADRTADLTRSNAELARQQSFLDAILDNVDEGIMACDADGRLRLTNAATRRMHGVPAAPLPADGWAEYYNLYEPDGQTPLPPDRAPLARVRAGEVVRDAEVVIRPRRGPDRFVLCSGQPLTAPGGGRFGAVVSMRDVTERREYERQLVATTALLKTSNAELEKFAYIASHDLQEPLRKIQAFGDRLASKSRDALGDSGRDSLGRILDSAGRMRRLIDDLLSFSRVSTKGLPFERVDCGAAVRDVLSDLEDQLARTGGRVEVGPLPTLVGDVVQIRQVFQNLIGNALKFAREGVPPLVNVAAVPFAQVPPTADPPPPAGSGWRITVADNGIGFEPQYGERIFELFQRLHGRTQYEGTGLGLAIVRKIVVRHGATVVARSTPGSGTTFVIDWPTRDGSG